MNIKGHLPQTLCFKCYVQLINKKYITELGLKTNEIIDDK